MCLYFYFYSAYPSIIAVSLRPGCQWLLWPSSHPGLFAALRLPPCAAFLATVPPIYPLQHSSPTWACLSKSLAGTHTHTLLPPNDRVGASCCEIPLTIYLPLPLCLSVVAWTPLSQ